MVQPCQTLRVSSDPTRTRSKIPRAGLLLVHIQLQPQWDHELQLIFSRKASALARVAIHFSRAYTTLLFRNIIFSLEEMNREESP